MPITSLKVVHPELGSICFDDGKAIPDIAGSKDRPAKWVCFPEAGSRDTEFEIYLPGDSSGPRDLERAISALRHRKRIESAGRRLSASNVSLAWIDLTTDPPNVGFPDDEHIYVIWRGDLNDQWRIENLERGSW
jgi:hypothetical protein